jgi:GNAT superfamily N-acetyltransferase
VTSPVATDSTRTSIRWADPPDDAFLRDISALFDRNGREKPLDVLRWQYLDGVAGPATAVGLSGADGLGALYATVPRRILVDGREVRGAQSLDVMTDNEWRGRGLYLRMAADTYRRLGAGGTSLVFGFPNGEAMPGFRGELGWESFGAVPFLVRPLARSAARHRVGLQGGRPRVEHLLPGVISCTELPDGIDGLWRRFARGLRVGVVRDAAFLEWRLLQRPDTDYRLFAAYSKGRLVAFGGVSVVDRHGARIGYVLELLVDPAEPRAGRLLLRQLARHAGSRGADLLMAWNPPRSPTRPVFRWAGFAPLPEALRPVELHFGCRVFDRRASDLLACLAPDSWYLSYLDSDTV